MAIKPSEGHMDWITDDDTNKYIAPSAGKRLQGWIQQEKPPFQYFNWAWRLIDRWLKWADAQSDENAAAIAANTQAIGELTPSHVSAANASQVTVTTSLTSVLSVDPVSVKAGDLFDMHFQIWGEKVTAEGDVMIAIANTGTATVENITGWPYGMVINSNMVFRQYIATYDQGSDSHVMNATIPCAVTADGTFELDVFGFVNVGGNFVIPADHARFGLIFRRKQ